MLARVRSPVDRDQGSIDFDNLGVAQSLQVLDSSPVFTLYLVDVRAA